MFFKVQKALVSRVVLILALLSGMFGTALVQAAPSVDFGLAKSMGADRVSAIALDESGNIYTTGDFYGTTDFDPGVDIYNLTPLGSRDVFVSKVDSQGGFVWAKKMGGTDLDFSLAMDLDLAGNIYTTGHFTGTADFDPGLETYELSSKGENDIFVSKLDNGGNFVWAKTMGSASGDLGAAVALDANADVYTAGFFSGTVDFDPGANTHNLTSSGNYDIFMSKLDSSGNFIWAKSIGGSSEDRGRDMVLDRDGNLYITGIFSGTVDFDPGAGTYNLSGTRQQFISKLDGNGNLLWAKSIGSGSDHVSINVDMRGNAYTTSEFSGTVDFDPGSGTYNLTSTGPNDIFIIKLNTNGNFLWARNFGGNSNYEYSEDIELDDSGNVYTTGSYSGTADFDPSAGTYNLSSQGLAPASDIFISKLNSRGNFVWAKSMGGTNTDSGFAIAPYKGHIYTVGNFDGTADFDPGPGVSNLSSTGGMNTFISDLYETVIRYVKWDANGENNGTSWEDAYPDLQSALSASFSGDEIWVAAGTYKPTVGTDRTATFQLKTGVALYGGFAGMETERDQRIAAANSTILSGDLNGDDVDFTNNFENVYHVVTGSTGATLDGFTITAGNANGAGIDWAEFGGGMLNIYGSSTLTNVTFTKNAASSMGGGMHIYSSSPKLTNVTFSGNSAPYGGGIFNYTGSPILANITFSGNSADLGGGMYNYISDNIKIYNTIFWGNTGVQVYNNHSSPEVNDSVIQGGCPDGSTCKNIFITDPNLGPLGNYGGFNQTIPLLVGSSAIDSGDDAFCPATDQRGVTRPQGSHCDIGAYEYDSADLDVIIGGDLKGSYSVGPSESIPQSYSLNNGPVKVVGTNTVPFLVAERDAWLLNGVVQSFSEMMGLPGNQVTDTYYFPWYNNVTMDTQLRFANLGNTSTNITVTIAGIPQTPITVAAGKSTRVSYPGINAGPVKVQSSGGTPIIVAERDAWLVNGVVQSFSEMMGLPGNKATDTYYFPWYNNVTMDTQLRFANLGNTSTNITVTIAGVAKPAIPLAPGQSTRVSYPVNNGPVKVQSSGGVPIIVAERDAWLINGVVRSFSEMMGLPGNQLTTTYHFPWYNNVTMDTQLRFANLGNASTNITVTIAGVAQPPITVPAGVSTRISYPVNNGPVKVQSSGGVPIIVAERDAWLLNGAVRSFSEMMGLPGNQLTTTYYFPWYNNLTMDTQLRFAVP